MSALGSSITRVPPAGHPRAADDTTAILALVLLGLAVGVGTSYPLLGIVGTIGVFVGASLWIGVDVARIAALGLVGNTALNLSAVLADRYDAPSAAKPIVLVMLTLIAYDVLRRRRLPDVHMAGFGALLLFIAATGASVLTAYRTEVALPAFVDLMKSGVFAAALAVLLARPGALRQACVIVLAGVSVLAAIGTYQGITGDYDTEFWGLAGAQVMHITGEIDSFRVGGPYGDPNVYARVLLLALPLALYEFRYSPWVLGRTLAAIALLALLGGLVFSFSRGALFAAIVPLVLTAARMHTNRRLLLALGVICAGGMVYLAPPTLWDRIAAAFGATTTSSYGRTIADASVENRVDEMWLAVKMFLDHPLLGVGPDNYAELFQRYTIAAGAVLRHEDREAHSLLLEIAAEQGLVGLSAFVLLLGIAAHGLWAAARDVRLADADRDLAFAIGAAIIGYLTASIFLHDAYPEYFWLFVGMAFAVPVANRSE